jgi:hypothetical protein
MRGDKLNKKVVSLDKFKSNKTKAKNLASGDPQEVGRLYSEDLSMEFNDILKEQRRNKKDERSKPDS